MTNRLTLIDRRCRSDQLFAVLIKRLLIKRLLIKLLSPIA
eukprot:CAMPEP_0201231198 /NCGR_PEP_ID=MMETSP0852-20130820/2905_1 /ASSEMBLY_ACC=CAM_ASM_000632 /TAXON_ID=183588 /ORGANISM="Pseudo-nitzschia fraudulenta, Strain WWA7" /LENGTH=39 /DNA_ID= /DNA_START= /DNA_END= /DNA_ORIENTATION=